MKKEKIIKSAKTLDKIFMILSKFLIGCGIVIFIVIALLTLINYVNPNSIIRSSFNQIEIGPLSFLLNEQVASNNTAVLVYTWIMFLSAIAFIVIIYYALKIIRKILAPTCEGNPFHPSVGKDIKKLAFASLIIGIVQNITLIISTLTIFNIVDFNSIIQNSQIQSISTKFSFDLSFIIIFLVLLLISHIFIYGEELQKLSDETL